MMLFQTYPLESLRQFNVVESPEQYLGELKWNNKLAIAISHEKSCCRTQVENSRVNIQNEIYCFDHPNIVHDYSLKMLVRSIFPHLNELNRFIRYASEHGLIVKWMKDYQSTHKGKGHQFQYSKFSLEFHADILVLFICMDLVACIILFIEWIIHKKNQEQNSKSFWRFAEMFIDPYRYSFLKDRSFK